MIAFSQTVLPTFQATHRNISSSSGSCNSSETMMPLPNNDASFSGNVRGFLFTAPINFCITGVRVPEHYGGAQDIAIVRFDNNTLPPLYPNTTNAFEQLHLTIGDNSTNKIVVDIQVTAGDIIGIYGYRDKKNAYSPNVLFTSNIGGHNVVFHRTGMQSPLDNAGMHDIYLYNSYKISLVEMYYKN